MAKPTLYLETSVPSYLTGRSSSNSLVAAQQELTKDWWVRFRDGYDIYVSEVVYAELERGDPEAAERRLAVVQGFPSLPLSDEAIGLAHFYVQTLPLPQSALADAFHLALASLHGMDYVVTWNCRHIARGSIKRALPGVNASRNLATPAICTPEELWYEKDTLDRPDSG